MFFVYQDNRIARLKDDLSGLAEEPWRALETEFPKEGYTEGAFLFKANGRYHLTQTHWSYTSPDFSNGTYCPPDKSMEVYSYDPVIASADSIKGPYGERYTSITGGGHGNFFQDYEGDWWACVFWNPRNKIPGTEENQCRPDCGIRSKVS